MSLGQATHWDSLRRRLTPIRSPTLRDRCALDGGDASLRATFVRYREHIEAIAGEKYREGRSPNALVLVLSKDLVPPVA